MVEHNHCGVCMDDTFVIWHRGLHIIQDFFNNISSLRLIIKVNMKTEADGAISFMDMLVIRIYIGHHSLQKTCIQWPLPPFLIASLTTWREELCRVYTTDLLPYANSSKTTQMKLIIWDTTYGFVSLPLDLLIWIKEKYSSEEWGKALSFISIWHVTDISEKYERIANRYNIKPICKGETYP